MKFILKNSIQTSQVGSAIKHWTYVGHVLIETRNSNNRSEVFLLKFW